ncbi:MAG TPA: arylamine N-acetyltransferase [Pilimelia sp.]|nr:arylamine N-acetyltransferase [Pilimelia sp.]
MLDLTAYLTRIGHDGPVRPDLPTLRALVLAHVTTIPFENLDPFAGQPVRLELAAIQDKLVAGGRGGYCFEQNRLLQAALDEVGFATGSLQARVLWGRPEDTITARGHKVLRVHVDGEPFLVDVGFGGMSLTGVLRLTPDVAQETPHGLFRLVRDPDDTWRQQALVRDEWRTTYRFDLHPTHPVDDEPANWYLSTWPGSHFVTGLIAARPTADGRRIALFGRELAVHQPDGTTRRRVLDDAGELRDVLERDLLIRVPDSAAAALHKLF